LAPGLVDRRPGGLAAAPRPAHPGPGHAAQPLHPRQHALRLLGRAPQLPEPLPHRRGAHRHLDPARHRRRCGGSCGGGDHAVRAAVRLTGRPHLLRDRASRARLHVGAAAVPRRGMGERDVLACLRRLPLGALQRDHRPARRQALLRRAAEPGRGRRRHRDRLRHRRTALRLDPTASRGGQRAARGADGDVVPLPILPRAPDDPELLAHRLRGRGPRRGLPARARTDGPGHRVRLRAHLAAGLADRPAASSVARAGLRGTAADPDALRHHADRARPGRRRRAGGAG